MARADLFDSELDAVRELAKNGFLRGAGAISGGSDRETSLRFVQTIACRSKRKNRR
jgi:hypothetical protein